VLGVKILARAVATETAEKAAEKVEMLEA